MNEPLGILIRPEVELGFHFIFFFYLKIEFLLKNK